MLEILVTGGISAVTATLSAIVTWLLAKKKYNAEVDNNVIENMKQSLEFYERLSDDNKARLTEVLEQNKQVIENNRKLEEDISDLRKQMLALTTKICLDFTCKHRQTEPKEN